MLLSTQHRYYKARFKEQAFEKISANGYNACDYLLYLCKSPVDCSDQPPFSEVEKQCTKHKAQAEKHGVQILQTHAGFYTVLDSYDAEYEKAYIAHTKKQIVMSRLLGAKYMVVHPVQPYQWGDDLEVERTAKLNVRILDELAEYAKQEGIILALENMPCVFPTVPCCSPEMILSIVDTVGKPNLKICFDSGHANMASNFIGGSPKLTCGDYVNAFGSRIVCLHLHENNGKLDQHNMINTTPSGAPDWEEIFSALKKVGYDGSISSEADFSARLPDELFCEGEKLQAKLLSYYAKKFDL